MKKCSKCNEIKTHNDFGKRGDSKDGLRNDCKECVNSRNKSHYYSNKRRISTKRKELYASKKHSPIVYLLMSENYVGVTENFNKRMNRHSSSGRIVNDAVILSEFESRSEALELEVFLHDLGYKGRHKYNSYY